ncbi:MAG: hypothetical protein ACK521_12085 [bacterium]|jgi:hypothetical protein
MLVSFIQDKEPTTRIHLVLWQVSLRRITELKQHFFFANMINGGGINEGCRSPRKDDQAMPTFETVTL